MKLTLRSPEVALLNRILMAPDSIGQPSNLQQPHPIYQASDATGSKQVIALRKWLEQRVMEPTGRGGSQFKVDAVYKGGLKQTYVNRLIEVMDHYKALGMAATKDSEAYWNIYDQLKGNKIVDENLDDVEDIEDDADDPEQEGGKDDD